MLFLGVDKPVHFGILPARRKAGEIDMDAQSIHEKRIALEDQLEAEKAAHERERKRINAALREQYEECAKIGHPNKQHHAKQDCDDITYDWCQNCGEYIA